MNYPYLTLMRSVAAEHGKLLLSVCLHFMSSAVDQTQEFNYEH